MEEHIAKAYLNARRFDEGEIIDGQEYKTASKRRMELEDQMVAAFGEGIMELLEDYACVLYDQMELEAQHFFLEGYQAAKGENEMHA